MERSVHGGRTDGCVGRTDFHRRAFLHSSTDGVAHFIHIPDRACLYHRPRVRSHSADGLNDLQRANGGHEACNSCPVLTGRRGGCVGVVAFVVQLFARSLYHGCKGEHGRESTGLQYKAPRIFVSRHPNVAKDKCAIPKFATRGITLSAFGSSMRASGPCIVRMRVWCPSRFARVIGMHTFFHVRSCNCRSMHREAHIARGASPRRVVILCTVDTRREDGRSAICFFLVFLGKTILGYLSSSSAFRDKIAAA